MRIFFQACNQQLSETVNLRSQAVNHCWSKGLQLLSANNWVDHDFQLEELQEAKHLFWRQSVLICWSTGGNCILKTSTTYETILCWLTYSTMVSVNTFNVSIYSVGTSIRSIKCILLKSMLNRGHPCKDLIILACWWSWLREVTYCVWKVSIWARKSLQEARGCNNVDLFPRFLVIK